MFPGLLYLPRDLFLSADRFLRTDDGFPRKRNSFASEECFEVAGNEGMVSGLLDKLMEILAGEGEENFP